MNGSFVQLMTASQFGYFHVQLVFSAVPVLHHIH